MHFLGILDDVNQQGTYIPSMQSYKLPGGIEPLDSWDFLERLERSPSMPYVSRGVVFLFTV